MCLINLQRLCDGVNYQNHEHVYLILQDLMKNSAGILEDDDQSATVIGKLVKLSNKYKR